MFLRKIFIALAVAGFLLWGLAKFFFPETFSSDPHKQDLVVARKVVDGIEASKDWAEEKLGDDSSYTERLRQAAKKDSDTDTSRGEVSRPYTNEQGERVLFEGEVVDAQNNRILTQQVIETDKKYALEIHQRIWEEDETQPSGRNYLGERAFVADHVLVRVHQGYDPSLVASVLRNEGMGVRKQLNDEGLYLVEFPVMSHDSWNLAVQRLQQLDMVQAVAADFLTQTD